MSKNGKRTIVMIAILFVVFSVITFTIPFEKNAVLFIAYAFAVVAIACQLYVMKVSFAHGQSVKSKFYGLPIARIGICYLVTQLVASIVEMACASFLPTWVAIITNVIILAAALIGLISAEMMRDEVERQDVKIKHAVSNMRTIQSMATTVTSMCEDVAAKTKLQNIADEIKYSDPVSAEATKGLEQNILSYMKDIQNAVVEKNYDRVSILADKTMIDLKERNRICSVSK